ncbi:MAG: hypothetical protein KGL53_08260, partial [Elusimicrobia bacterium]|nr:hypothetical protein [Elusimicrobiota bacterium]
AAALLSVGAKVGAERLISGALALAGTIPKPKDQPGLGEEVRGGAAVESAAAAWAGSLPNAKRSDPVHGTVKALGLQGTLRSLRGRFGF